jgi:hypothetical protein
MKKISQGLTGQIFLFYIISFVFIPFVMADEIATRLIESNPICSPEIQIQLNLPENQLSCAIEESIPTGLIPSNISHSGVWDYETRCIKWGLFNDHETINLSYQLTGIKTTIQLNGSISIDGIDQFITGDSTVSIDCMPEKEQLSSPVFDPPGGSIVPVNLMIRSDDIGAIIRYTLDGSLPNISSTLFTEAIYIDSHSVVRAATFKQDYLSGDAVSATYYEPSSTTILRTVFDSNTCSPGVKLSVTANDIIHSIAILETISNGLYPENISNNGVWDSDSQTIKWGLIHGNSSYELSYHLRGFKGDYELSGNASVNGTPVDINGTSTITLSCDIQQVALPKFQPRSGTPFPITVKIFCDTPDAIVHYTLDNSLPDQNSPIYSIPLSVTSATKIKAIAFKSDFIQSPLAVGIYPEPTIEHIILSRTIDPDDACFPNITIEIEPIIFTRAIAVKEIIPMGLHPSSISHNGVWDEISHTIKWGLFLTNNPLQINYQLTGVAGEFILNGDGSFDGYELSIKGDTSVSVNCMPELDIVESPIFEPSEDSILPVEVLITCETPDAEIYYTTDGSMPDQKSTLFSEVLTIHSKTVVRAIAFKSGMQPSDVISMAYVKSFSEKPYDITHNIQSIDLCAVSISIDISPHQSVKSYAYEEHLPTGIYPTDISENGIWIENEHIIRWGLFNDHLLNPLSYTINVPAGLHQLQGYVSYDGYIFQEEIFSIESDCGKPLEKIDSVTFSPDSGSQIPAMISIQCDTPDVMIYFTTDGQLPDETSQLYESSISINHATTIRAIAVKNGMEKSDVRTAYYKNPPPLKTIQTSLSNDNSCRPHVTISVDPTDINANYAIESYLDDGIMPGNISHQGRWDEQTHTIRWGILSENQEVSFDIHGENGSYQIFGEISINGQSMSAYDNITINMDCYLAIEQGDSVLVVMDEDGQFNPPQINLLDPIDPNAESLIWEMADAPTHGTATVSGTGFSPEIHYQPDKDWYGNDAFNIIVSDNNSAMDMIRINVNVNSINDPPAFQLANTEINLNEDFSTPHYLTITPLPIPFGESDQTITYQLLPVECELAKLSIDSLKNRIIITSKAEANGSEIIHVIASDGQISYTQTFLLNIHKVNDPPAFTLNAHSISLSEDFSEPYHLSVISGYVPADEIYQKITYSIIPESLSWADLQIDPDSGFLTIRSIPDKNGSGQLTIIANDGADQHSTFTNSITLTVLAENDPPKFSLNANSITLTEDFEQVQEIHITPGIIPEDEQNQVIDYYLEPEPSSLTLVNMHWNKAERKILIQSKANQNGQQTFTIFANDGQNNHNMYSETFQIAIQPVNDKPEFQLNSDNIESLEDFISSVCVGLSLNIQPPDEQNQTITFSIMPSKVDWVNLQMSDRTGEVCFNSVPDKNGQDTFIIRADDHQLTNNFYEKSFSFSVYPVNDPPYFDLSESEVTLLEDFLSEKTLTITLQPVPSDETQQRIIYTMTPVSVDFANISIHPLTGQLTISSIPNKSGYQSFTITADDRQIQNSKATKNFVLNVESRNDPPEFKLSQPVLDLDEDFAEPSIVSINPLPVPEDEQNEQVVYYLTPMSVNWVNINVNNLTKQIEITAIENASGHQIFSIIADDGQREDFIFEQPFELTVNAVNDSPIANAGNDQEVDEGTRLTLNGYQSSDIDNNDLSYQWKQLSGISAIIENDNNSIAYVHVPKVLHDGEQIIFRLIVSDGKLNNVDDICISIRNIVKQGDINDDGNLNLLDVILMLELISDINDSQNQLFTDHADINLNGYIELADVLFLIKLIAE